MEFCSSCSRRMSDKDRPSTGPAILSHPVPRIYPPVVLLACIYTPQMPWRRLQVLGLIHIHQSWLLSPKTFWIRAVSQVRIKEGCFSENFDNIQAFFLLRPHRCSGVTRAPSFQIYMLTPGKPPRIQLIIGHRLSITSSRPYLRATIIAELKPNQYHLQGTSQT